MCASPELQHRFHAPLRRPRLAQRDTTLDRPAAVVRAREMQLAFEAPALLHAVEATPRLGELPEERTQPVAVVVDDRPRAGLREGECRLIRPSGLRVAARGSAERQGPSVLAIEHDLLHGNSVPQTRQTK